jgi:TRAP-type C4-dicarboxylate transport system substrate-binding protein
MRMGKLSTSIAIGALVAVVAPHAGALAAGKVLKFASFVPPKYVLHKPIFEKMANDVAKATNGGLKIRIYPSGALGKGPVQQYVRAVRGVADITMGVTGYTSSLFPKTLLIELPGVSADGVDATRRMWQVMDKDLRAEYRGTHVLAAYATPPSVFMTTKKPIRSLADVKGLKLRTPSKAAGEILRAYGASPVSMPATKVYTAMSTGVIDGALMGSDSLLIFKLIEPTKYVTTNLPEMPTALFIVMNEGSWKGLTPAQKAAVTKASGEKLSVAAAKALAAFGAKALKIFASKPGKEVIRLSAKARAAFDAAAAKGRAAIVASMEKNGVPAGQVIADMKK